MHTSLETDRQSPHYANELINQQDRISAEQKKSWRHNRCLSSEEPEDPQKQKRMGHKNHVILLLHSRSPIVFNGPKTTIWWLEINIKPPKEELPLSGNNGCWLSRHHVTHRPPITSITNQILFHSFLIRFIQLKITIHENLHIFCVFFFGWKRRRRRHH